MSFESHFWSPYNVLKNKSYFTRKTSLFGTSRGIACWHMQTMVSLRQVYRDKGKVTCRRFWEETGEGCHKQKFTGEEQECKVVAASHWWWPVISTLLQGQKRSSFFFLKAGDEIPLWKMPSLVNVILSFPFPAGFVEPQGEVCAWDLPLQGFLTPF